MWREADEPLGRGMKFRSMSRLSQFLLGCKRVEHASSTCSYAYCFACPLPASSSNRQDTRTFLGAMYVGILPLTRKESYNNLKGAFCVNTSLLSRPGLLAFAIPSAIAFQEYVSARVALCDDEKPRGCLLVDLVCAQNQSSNRLLLPPSNN
jgi:hypothetical protein